MYLAHRQDYSESCNKKQLIRFWGDLQIDSGIIIFNCLAGWSFDTWCCAIYSLLQYALSYHCVYKCSHILSQMNKQAVIMHKQINVLLDLQFLSASGHLNSECSLVLQVIHYHRAKVCQHKQ